MCKNPLRSDVSKQGFVSAALLSFFQVSVRLTPSCYLGVATTTHGSFPFTAFQVLRLLPSRSSARLILTCVRGMGSTCWAGGGGHGRMQEEQARRDECKQQCGKSRHCKGGLSLSLLAFILPLPHFSIQGRWPVTTDRLDNRGPPT